MIAPGQNQLPAEFSKSDGKWQLSAKAGTPYVRRLHRAACHAGIGGSPIIVTFRWLAKRALSQGNRQARACDGPARLAFDDPHGTEPGDLAGDAGPVDHLDDLVDVLVSGRLFLGQSLVAPGAGDDAQGIKLFVDPSALR